MTIDLFKTIQLVKIRHAAGVLNQLWFRGVLTIYHYGKYLKMRNREYHDLVYYQKALVKYVREARQRALELPTV